MPEYFCDMSKDESKIERSLLRLYYDRRKDIDARNAGRRAKRQSRPKVMQELLKAYFANDSQAIKKIEEYKVILRWKEWVGPVAARSSQVLRVKNSRLIVAVSDPLWMQQLLFLKSDLLKQVRRSFPGLGISDIFFIKD